jgi:hypothetical protein
MFHDTIYFNTFSQFLSGPPDFTKSHRQVFSSSMSNRNPNFPQGAGGSGPPGPRPPTQNYPQSYPYSGRPQPSGGHHPLNSNYGSQDGRSNAIDAKKKKKKKQKPAVRGLARRKGERQPWHYGFDIRDDLVGHPAPEGFPKNKCKGCGKESKECVLM